MFLSSVISMSVLPKMGENEKNPFNSSAVCTVPTTAITIIENGHKLFKHSLIAHYGKGVPGTQAKLRIRADGTVALERLSTSRSSIP